MKLFWREIVACLSKEWLLEWRNRFALNGLLLYLVCIIFVCYLSFRLKNQMLTPSTWNALFWIAILFALVNNSIKSFNIESDKRWYFYYFLFRPESIIIAKMLYNGFFSVVIGLVTWFLYGIVMQNPVQDTFLFLVNLVSGCMGIAIGFTMVSAIAHKAQNSATLTAVLGFPLILPVLLLTIKISKHAIEGLERSLVYQQLITIWAIILISIATSLLLFPFSWKE